MSKLLIAIIFLVLFVIFVYGALLVALLGLANWLIHSFISYKLAASIASIGFFGVCLVALACLVLWICCNLAISYVLYFLVKISGRKIAAYKIYNISLFALFHIFAMPLVLWGIIRQNSPYLKHLYYQKLRRLAKTPLMQERLAERALKATNRP